MKAIWNGATLAESDHCVVVEGNQYFPPDAVNRTYFRQSDAHTTCSWKVLASYCTIAVNGQTNTDAARQIKDYVAFWHGIIVA